MAQIIAEITQQARKSPDINQRSGVSVRASIANYESVLATAFRRSIEVDEKDIVPRISDLPFIMPSLQGKIEFEAMEEGREEKIMERLLQDAVRNVFARFSEDLDMETLALQFADGLQVTTGESMASDDYEDIISRVDGLNKVVTNLSQSDCPAIRASAIEFVLEGLHLNQLLNKDRVGNLTTYIG